MKKIAIVLGVFLLCGGIAYQAFATFNYNNNYERCVARAQNTSLIRGDVGEFCGCTTNYIKGQLFFDKNDPAFRKGYRKHIFSCMIQHTEKYGSKLCDEAKKELQGSEFDMDCSCLHRNVLGELSHVLERRLLEENPIVRDKIINNIKVCIR